MTPAALARRVWRASIWHPDAVPPLERKYATPLKRFLFPFFDVAMVVIGVQGLTVGIPSLDTMFPGPVATVLYTAWVVVAALCFVGAVIPRLWVLEVGGKVALFTLLTVYFIALRVAAATDPDGSRDAVSVFVFVAMLIPLLRLWILGIEERARKDT